MTKEEIKHAAEWLEDDAAYLAVMAEKHEDEGSLTYHAWLARSIRKSERNSRTLAKHYWDQLALLEKKEDDRKEKECTQQNTQ